ncbi:MucBP domain-containing protein [Streptococcus caprae]|uniref:MucBP domain-containing protein n=1 Tax=Streptococcus caprae TaxID=1640501 RepID=A0ABV8CTQ3_9STRE
MYFMRHQLTRPKWRMIKRKKFFMYTCALVLAFTHLSQGGVAVKAYDLSDATSIIAEDGSDAIDKVSEVLKDTTIVDLVVNVEGTADVESREITDSVVTTETSTSSDSTTEASTGVVTELTLTSELEEINSTSSAMADKTTVSSADSSTSGIESEITEPAIDYSTVDLSTLPNLLVYIPTEGATVLSGYAPIAGMTVDVTSQGETYTTTANDDRTFQVTLAPVKVGETINVLASGDYSGRVISYTVDINPVEAPKPIETIVDWVPENAGKTTIVYSVPDSSGDRIVDQFILDTTDKYIGDEYDYTSYRQDTLVSNDLTYKLVKTDGKETGKLIGSDQTITYYYEPLIGGDVSVVFQDEAGNVLQESIKVRTSAQVGETYDSSSSIAPTLTIDGKTYTLVNQVGQVSGRVTEQNQVLTLIYAVQTSESTETNINPSDPGKENPTSINAVNTEEVVTAVVATANQSDLVSEFVEDDYISSNQKTATLESLSQTATNSDQAVDSTYFRDYVESVSSAQTDTTNSNNPLNNVGITEPGASLSNDGNIMIVLPKRASNLVFSFVDSSGDLVQVTLTQSQDHQWTSDNSIFKIDQDNKQAIVSPTDLGTTTLSAQSNLANGETLSQVQFSIVLIPEKPIIEATKGALVVHLNKDAVKSKIRYKNTAGKKITVNFEKSSDGVWESDDLNFFISQESGTILIPNALLASGSQVEATLTDKHGTESYAAIYYLKKNSDDLILSIEELVPNVEEVMTIVTTLTT